MPRACAVLLALLVGMAFAAPAAAATSFGGDPSQPILAGATCSQNYAGYPGVGSSSCLWETTDPYGGHSDYVPFPASGGSGTITSVTLPAMPHPGPMQVVVLTAALNTSCTLDDNGDCVPGSPGSPNYACCQTKEISPVFTVKPNRITTVPLNLHVTDSEVNDPNAAGDTSFSDVMALSVLSPTASLPLAYTGSSTMVNTVRYPAPAHTSGEFEQYGYSGATELLARFALSTGGGGAMSSPAGGVRLSKTVAVPRGARSVTLGRATDPPTAKTSQRLTASSKALAAARKPKQRTVAKGRTRLKAGKRARIRVKLSRLARRRLAHGHRIKCRLTLVARGTSGRKKTIHRRVTLKPKRRKRR